MLTKDKKIYQETSESVVDPDTSICYSFTLESVFPENITFNYVPCGGGTASIVLNDSSTIVCAKSVTPPGAATNKWNIIIGDECGG